MIARLAHVCLCTTDLEKTRKFYCDVLGVPKKFNFTRKGRVVGYYLDMGGGTFLEIFIQEDLKGPDNRVPLKHLCLEVPSIDEMRSRLEAHNIPLGEKTLGLDNSWQAWFKDPNGVEIEFHEYTAKSCQVTGAECVLEK
jgi:glyoxylase I family protein